MRPFPDKNAGSIRELFGKRTLKFDFIIIGGGIVGTSLAYELAKYELAVVLLEREAELSFGVSKANSGIVHTGFQSDFRQLKTRLAVRGNEDWKSWTETGSMIRNPIFLEKSSPHF
jgi:L-2-hydroxyglutarate oxidase LhgO